MKNRKVGISLFVILMMVASIVTVPNLTSYGASKYHNYSPDKKGKTTATVNMRSGSSTKNKKLTTIPKGKTITLYGYDEVPGYNWYKTKYNGKTGYVRRDNVKVTSSSSSNKYHNYSPDKKGKTTATINMRSGSSTKKKKVTTIPKGKTITLYGYDEVPGYNWYKTKYNGKTGYVRRDNVKVTSSSSSAASKITISGATKPTTITEGKNFSIKGKLKSTYKMTEVKVGIMKISTGKFYSNYVGTAKPNATTYDIHKLNNKVPFEKAQPGTYYYTVQAKDSKGKTVNVIKQKFTVKASSNSGYHAYSSTKSGKTTTAVNMRKGAGTNHAKIITVPESKRLTIYGYMEVPGYNWYKVKYNGNTGYIRRDYIKVIDTSNVSDIKGFPSSYQPALKELQAEHPNWKFVPKNTGMSWSTLVKNEMRGVSTQLVEPTSPSSWKSKAKGAYNSKTGKYTKFDGRWNAASEAIVKYYLDPRNFLDESSIYQFMTHGFNSSFQNKSTVKAGAKGSFMATESYYNWIYNAGKNSGVNPNVIVSMLIMEQGWNGTSSLISGKYKGYKGYYNYFNIGAYASGSMNSVQRGLWYAKGEGKNKKTWNRTWTSREKSITGGAQFYASQYLENDQGTYYSKKFNVMNGASNAGKHEYCTNVQAADTEGKLLKKGFSSDNNLPLVFEIPVYTNMPSSNAPMPK